MKRFKPKDSEIVHSPPEMDGVPARKLGRPAKLLSHEKRAKLLELIRESCTLKSACAAIGITPHAYYSFLEKAEDPNAAPMYRQFADEVALAEAAAERDLIGRIKSVADSDSKDSWRAAAFLLQHHPRHRENWGRDSTPDGLITANFGGLQIHIHLEATPEELAAERARKAAIELQPTVEQRLLLDNAEKDHAL